MLSADVRRLTQRGRAWTSRRQAINQSPPRTRAHMALPSYIPATTVGDESLVRQYWQRMLEGEPPNHLTDSSNGQFLRAVSDRCEASQINIPFYIIVSERRGIWNPSLVLLLTDITNKQANCLGQHCCSSWALHYFSFLV